VGEEGQNVGNVDCVEMAPGVWLSVKKYPHPILVKRQNIECGYCV